MTPFYTDPLVTLLHGDCIEVMAELPADSVDAVVCDPPYGLEFMGKDWDAIGSGPLGNRSGTKPEMITASGMKLTGSGNPTTRLEAPTLNQSRGYQCLLCGKWRGGRSSKFTCQCETPRFVNRSRGPEMQSWHEAWAREAFRVAKPGAYLLAFGGTRTVHRLACAIEDAGWEIRDQLEWIYASGFPKSLDVSKALDKVAGAEREVVGERDRYLDGRKRQNLGPTGGEFLGLPNGVDAITAPATDLARKWEGWGTALKPAHEPIVMARKPLVGTVAGNVTRYGTGALNIGATRIATDENYVEGFLGREPVTDNQVYGKGLGVANPQHPAGRWPSNVLLSDPELFDEPNPGVVGSGATPHNQDPTTRQSRSKVEGVTEFGTGESIEYEPTDAGYSRFFIIPKSDRAERERGLAGREKEGPSVGKLGLGQGSLPQQTPHPPVIRANTHPTVKPIDLMRHLVRLVTPPGGVCLDPFLGSGTTALAASEEGMKCIGIEREREYLDIAVGRLIATPMGLGLDVGAPVRKRGTTGRQGPDQWIPHTAKGWSGGWSGDPDEEPAA